MTTKGRYLLASPSGATEKKLCRICLETGADVSILMGPGWGSFVCFLYCTIGKGMGAVAAVTLGRQRGGIFWTSDVVLIAGNDVSSPFEPLDGGIERLLEHFGMGTDDGPERGGSLLSCPDFKGGGAFFKMLLRFLEYFRSEIGSLDLTSWDILARSFARVLRPPVLGTFLA